MTRDCLLGHSRWSALRLARSIAGVAALLAAACGHDRGNGTISATSVALTASTTSPLAVGQTATVYVHASDANGTRIPHFSAVTWLSSNPTVASVSKSDTTAIVTGVAAGEAVISAAVTSTLVARMTVRVGAIPVIGVSPSAVVFTGYRNSSVAPQSVVITNEGAGALTGLSASTTATWLQTSFVGGIASANPTATLLLQPTVGTLTEGSYNTSVTISSSLAGVAARTVTVTFQVGLAPAAFKIEASSPPFQSGSAGKPVARPPAVIVRSADDIPVPGVPVTFAVSGGGTIAPTGVIMTDANGAAALSSWTLGSQSGASQVVTAASPGLAGSPVTFTASALSASKIVKVSGDNQSAVIGRPLPQPVVVRVTDPNGAPVPNATVTFGTAGGAAAPATATTDANGDATATWTLGTALGAQTLTASLVGPQGAPSVTFTATGTGATTIAKVGGDGQQAPAGSTLALPVRVRVTGADAQPVIGVAVTFAPAPGSGSVPSPTAVTDANGEASSQWTLAPATGAMTLVASIEAESGPASVTFGATATAPPPGGIVIVDGDNQTGRAGTALTRQVVAKVVTTIGTGIAGATVTFTPASGAGASFSPSSGTTDANGEVRTTWTLGSALGAYTGTVASPGLPSRTITATATQLAPNATILTGGALKVPGGAAPSAGDQAVMTYSGPASGEVALAADGSFTTPTLPPGTYTVTIVSRSGAFPSTVVYGVGAVGGQVTSIGTISVAYPGTGTLRIAVHTCPQVGEQDGVALVKLYAGVNGDQSGSAPAYSWTLASGVPASESGVSYGIYTMVIIGQHTSDPTKTCAVYRAGVEHSQAQTGGLTVIPLITLSNP